MLSWQLAYVVIENVYQYIYASVRTSTLAAGSAPEMACLWCRDFSSVALNSPTPENDDEPFRRGPASDFRSLLVAPHAHHHS